MFNPTLFPATLKDIFKSVTDTLPYAVMAGYGYIAYLYVPAPSFEFMSAAMEKGLYVTAALVGTAGIAMGVFDTALKIREYRYYKKLARARTPQ